MKNGRLRHMRHGGCSTMAIMTTLKGLSLALAVAVAACTTGDWASGQNTTPQPVQVSGPPGAASPGQGYGPPPGWGPPPGYGPSINYGPQQQPMAQPEPGVAPQGYVDPYAG